jgi:hypothetical protein
MKLFLRGIDALSSAAAWLATWCVLFACAVSASNAVTRYLFSVGSNAWLEMHGALRGDRARRRQDLRLNGHVRVDLFTDAHAARQAGRPRARHLPAAGGAAHRHVVDAFVESWRIGGVIQRWGSYAGRSSSSFDRLRAACAAGRGR